MNAASTQSLRVLIIRAFVSISRPGASCGCCGKSLDFALWITGSCPERVGGARVFGQSG